MQKIMKKRFKNILTRSPKKNGRLLCIGSICITLISGMLIGCSAMKHENGDAENPPVVELEEDAFRSILLDKSEFICTDLENEKLKISEIGQAVTDDDSITVSASRFTSVDLDGDGEDEVILWL